jgi:Ca-activated chloride channel family protein
MRFLEKQFGRLSVFLLPLLMVLTASSHFDVVRAQTGHQIQPGGGPEGGDRTLSPYFFVKSDDPSVDQLPLKSTRAEVKVAGVIADVTVVQVYRNEGRKPLEAVYVFPASTRAAVYGMRMTIGERTIQARIEKRDEARQAYENARREGKGASLLEQHRPNVFQMNVANIMPGDEIKTELRYTELLVPTDGVYELVYPTVVGPRYSNQPASQAPPSEKWSQNPYLHQGESPPYTFDLKIDLSAGLPIRDMTSSSHKVKIDYLDKTRAHLELDGSDRSGGNRDFILKYRLAGNKVESGLLLVESEGENFFLMMMQPPRRVTQADIPPREYIFIVDVSGSMHGYPLDISKKLLNDLIGGLRSTDSFNVLLFAGGSQLLSERSLPAIPENIRRAMDVIERQQGGGGTELLPALKRGLNLPRSKGVSRSFVIATDGYVAVEPEAFDLIREHLGDANFFTFGIGTSVNRHLIEGMARVGAGEPFVVTKPDEAPGMAEKLRQYIQSPVLTEIRVDFGGFEAYDMEPAHVPDLFAERPVLVYGKYRGTPEGTIQLRARRGEHQFEDTLNAGACKPMPENSALRYLWARARIAQLSDYNGLRPSDDRVRRITDLGLNYNLLTSTTSFVAIDSEVRRKGGDVTTVKQPLPLPEGVSDHAVGQAAPMMAGTMAASSRAGAMEMEFKKQALPIIDSKDGGTGGKSRDEGKGGRRASIQQLTVEGALTEEAARRVVESHLEEIGGCLQSISSAAKPLRLTFKWDILRDGTVGNLRLTTPRGGSNQLRECVKKLMEQWSFAAEKLSGTTRVTLILNIQG